MSRIYLIGFVVLAILYIAPIARAQHFPEAGTFDGDTVFVSGFNLPNDYGATVDTTGDQGDWEFDKTPQAGDPWIIEDTTPAQFGATPTPANGAWWTSHNTYWPGIPGGFPINQGNGDPKNPDHTMFNLTGFRWPGIIGEIEFNTAGSSRPFSNRPDEPFGFMIENVNFRSPTTGDVQMLPMLVVSQTTFAYARVTGPNGNGTSIQPGEDVLDAAGVAWGDHPLDFLNGEKDPRRVLYLEGQGNADDPPDNQGGTWDVILEPGDTVGANYAILSAAFQQPLDGLRFGSLIYQAIPGDYNLDGIVDIADYTTWADNFGAVGASFEQGDGNLDNVVDIADYTVWADHFGLGGAFHAAAVPEPSSFILLLGGLLMLVVRGRRCKP